ncbi:hypothetical protein HPB50_001922 [Hyalomma asiaticum]|uniref:Uncharacterized protein n=1 Tax=Hyalomma asiaticum TaxID=266040 RepID=A0ACB7TDA5_HYAAI|nr:hypothetical protein HPB50_001922 [Hyalomma asiaticum]
MRRAQSPHARPPDPSTPPESASRKRNNTEGDTDSDYNMNRYIISECSGDDTFALLRSRKANGTLMNFHIVQFEGIRYEVIAEC